MDVEGIRTLIREALAAMPAGAAEITEALVQGQPHPRLPEHREVRIVPRVAGAADLVFHVYELSGRVDIFVGGSPPIELTTPIDVNTGPPRPFLDVVREVVDDVIAGRLDLGTFPGSDYPLLGRWGDGRRDGNHGYPRKLRITWSSPAPWS
ncbi:hypothetical protein GCM10027451_36470 [Geodermatophilus aquaeductus]|uniref:hypothetical protein n=1 Tax=Geodermatophilus aquaeductus TaxID=1564161 RepID=UPI00115740DE|nr:hypothetical protein [Geodermatophilus aquaeductus]